MQANYKERLATSHSGGMPKQDAARNALGAKGRRSDAGEFRLHELATLSLGPIFRGIHRWWLQRAEQHYLICADVEQQRAREAQMNVAYYQKRAAMARSARI